MGHESLSPPTVTVEGSRLKAAALLAFAAAMTGVTLAVPSEGNPILLMICLGAGLFALAGIFFPGELTIDEQGVSWRTLLGHRSIDWSRIARADVGLNDGARAVYLQLADADGAPGRKRIWIPDYWSMPKAELAEAINAARRARAMRGRGPYGGGWPAA